ncbi:Urease [Cystobasidiomycetes sp. EMM_F5]
MGRIGEVISRTWRTASKMKSMRGTLTGDDAEADNHRVKRYISKYTVNVALTHGISEHVGSVEVGRVADLVMWDPANFGVRPKNVIKGGVIAWAQVGDANASIPTVEPVNGRPIDEAARWKLTDFVWPGSIESYRLSKKAIAVKGCRTVGKKDMKWNAEMPSITVDPETYRVEADGVHMTVEAATRLPLTQGYMLF